MPPEQFPWDRRDFRKHDRSGSDPRFGGGGGPHRWREQHHNPHAPPHPQPYHHNQNHQQQQRWYSDFRPSRPIPPGHGKQGGWPMYHDDSSHGFPPFGSRYGDRNLEDDNFRPFGNRGDGRYFRNSRENRGSFSQRDWRSPSWEPSASSSGPGRPTTEVNNHKSVETTETSHENNTKSNSSANPPLDSLPDQSQSTVQESNCKDGGGGGDAVPNVGQKSEKENGPVSVDWKPLKWSRSGSLSSRGSGLSHSSSSKSMGVDSDILVNEQQKNPTPVQSPAAVCVAAAAPAPTPTPSDETSSRKKPRLGWGEGLAKYEKKKVDGPEDVAAKDGLVCSVSDTETTQLPSVSPIDKSPRVASFSDCTESSTPTSIACSSSSGNDEKESVKAANIDHDTPNWSCSPTAMSQAQYDGPALNLENLELASIANLSSMINELLQSDAPSSTETGYARTTSMNKLLVWKVNILKALEVTESEIDSLETEMKSLVAEGQQVVSSGAMNFENLPNALENGHVALKDEEIDSPGSATSKLTEPQQFIEGNERLNSDNFQSLEEETRCTDNYNVIGTSCVDLGSIGGIHSNVGHIYGSICSSNKNSVKMCMEEFNKLLPTQQSLLDISTLLNTSSFKSDSAVIKERFLKRKRSLKLREKIITLKFKVFQHFWKDGRVVSVRKLRGKSHKKFDPSHIGCKKNHSTNRARISYSGGYLRTVPVEEVVDYINRLLPESPFKPCRNTLKMPALILDKDVRMSRFITNNALVEDPCAVEKERSMINPWTAEERELFIDKLAIFGKNFSKIASFLESKTIADCVEFYYKNHKSESFQRARKKPDFAKHKKSQNSTYLIASGKRWNRDAASLDILGEASAIAASVNDGRESQQKRVFLGVSNSHKRGEEATTLQRSNSLDMYNNETAAADVLAGICGSLSSEAMSSCITSSADLIDQRVGSCVKRPMTPEASQSVDDECSDESCGEMMDSTDWSDEEKSAFIRAVSNYGKDFTMIHQCVRTRTKEQCKIFFSKARKCLGLDKIQSGVSNGVSGDGDGGASETEDAFPMQTSVTGNDGSDPADVNMSNDSDARGTPNLESDSNGCRDNMDAEPVVKNSSIDANPAMDGEEQNDARVDESEVAISKNNFAEAENSDDKDSKAVTAVSEGHNGEHEEARKPILPAEDNLEKAKLQEKGVGSTEVTSIPSAANATESMRIGSRNRIDANPQGQNGHLPSVESSTLFSVPIKYQRHSSSITLSNGGSNGISEKDSETVDRQQHLSVYSRSDRDDFSQILRGYPVSLQSMKKMNKDVKLHSDNRRRDFSLQKCGGPPFQSQDKTREHSRSQSWSSSDVEKPSRNGDVKLFGKILTSAQQKPDSCGERKCGENLRTRGDPKVNFDSSQSKFDCNNNVCSENSGGSYGFWDANRGFAPLPDSALLLAKYPNAFSNNTIPSVKYDQHNLHGLSVFPNREMGSSNGVADYQPLRNRELLPFGLDMKQPQDVLFSEMQRRNGFDGMQQRSRGVVGINVVGRGGLIGQCSVSDPVAAIKLHYAKAQSSGLPGGNGDDKWTGNGDVAK